MEKLLNNFGQTIKDARLAAGLTQDVLAEQTGITTRYIMAIENESKLPRVKVLFKLIRTLKISADTIFYPEIQHADKEKEHILHNLYAFIKCLAKEKSSVFHTILLFQLDPTLIGISHNYIYNVLSIQRKRQHRLIEYLSLGTVFQRQSIKLVLVQPVHKNHFLFSCQQE